eukprot:XP_014007427.1 PREDICTED: aquaporin-3-like isoform X2 [Salmo salar]
MAGGVDQNKPVTVHKVFPAGVAAKEGSIQEGDKVLSINGTALCGSSHWEVLRTLRRARTQGMGVVVLRRGEVTDPRKGGTVTDSRGGTQTEPANTGQRVCVRLEKHSRDLGFSLEGGVGSSLGDKPLTVQKLFLGGPVNQVSPGDEVLEIEGVSLVGLRRLEAWTLIRTLPSGPVDVMFGCSASAQVKTSRETKGQYLSANMAFSVGVMSAMYLCKGVSGAHLNPAVTLSFCSLGRVPWVKLLPYTLSQVLGAYLASGLVFLVYYDAIMDFSGGNLTVYGANETASIFATYPAAHLSLSSSILDQVVATAMLMLCILPLDDQKNSPAPDALIPPIVAVIVLGIGMSMSSNCGGAINPARDLGPRLLTLTAGWGTEVL